MNEIALIGKKIGMTREFYKTGLLVPVTVLKMEKARVIQIIEEEKRGYKAVQLGYGKIKNSKIKGSTHKKSKFPETHTHTHTHTHTKHEQRFKMCLKSKTHQILRHNISIIR